MRKALIGIGCVVALAWMGATTVLLYRIDETLGTMSTTFQSISTTQNDIREITSDLSDMKDNLESVEFGTSELIEMKPIIESIERDAFLADAHLDSINESVSKTGSNIDYSLTKIETEMGIVANTIDRESFNNYLTNLRKIETQAGLDPPKSGPKKTDMPQELFMATPHLGQPKQPPLIIPRGARPTPTPRMTPTPLGPTRRDN